MEYDELHGHVQAFFNDRGRTASETKTDLQTLVSEIEGMIESLPPDDNDPVWQDLDEED